MAANVPPFVPPVADATLPPVPEDPKDALLNVLTHVIGLDTVAKRERITASGGAGVTSAIDVLLIYSKGLTERRSPATSGLAKVWLRTMKKWAEETYDIHGDVNIRDFNIEVCERRQMVMARTTRELQQANKGATVKGKLNTFNGKREHWLKARR
jgi:hypothetical protein